MLPDQPIWPIDLAPAIQQSVADDPRLLVVLDDDPTGTQTVHNIPVLTSWDTDTLRTEFARNLPCCYILTNSRSMPLAQAQALHHEIATNLRAASQATQRDFRLISRSDSTLRGHYPGETDALADILGQFTLTLIIPAFFAGGRYTINNIHYVDTNGQLLPAAQTIYSSDAAFGYHSSDLREWVAEKSAGRIPATTVASISIESIRSGGPEHIASQLQALAHGTVCVVNAAHQRDLEVVAAALFLVEKTPFHRILVRSAASFVAARLGQTTRPLLDSTTLALPATGAGLIIIGSYVSTTSQQLAVLKQFIETTKSDMRIIELDVPALLNTASNNEAIHTASTQLDLALQQNQTSILATSRDLIRGCDAEESLAIGNTISAALVAIIAGLTQQPRYILAKGGITSSDIATRALHVRRAIVLGQLLAGVPVWQLGPETRFPGIAYCIFPGNVGGPQALTEAILKLEHASGRSM
jgi:uncharacterized protein YgbK (DUF1537 family)